MKVVILTYEMDSMTQIVELLNNSESKGLVDITIKEKDDN